ncbi:uncharacterized protein LOC106637068 [Copidosoma floridanum]|uniref:uncharacterized protein LOC106637068 n=1 Tax=Copidosoma floridanum TaxID=29053 RepID=UPI0006C99A69|nr:uncharacterized protein LOC106637068 [Copidosoma floridanum]
MSKITILLILLVAAHAKERPKRQDLSCYGRAHHNATLAAYYPDFDSEFESDYLDAKGKKLRTLQDFIDGRAEFVTVAMDNVPKLKYGEKVCVPELNEHFGRVINLQIRDYNMDLQGKGYTRLDICVRTEADSYDYAVNRPITMYTTY